MKQMFTVLGLAGVMTIAALAQEKADGDADKGKELFEQCGACHAHETDEKKMGPSLKGLYKRAKLNNGSKVTDASVLKVINEGGNGMPPYADLLSDVEKKHIIAYLKTL